MRLGDVETLVMVNYRTFLAKERILELALIKLFEIIFSTAEYTEKESEKKFSVFSVFRGFMVELSQAIAG